MILTCEKCDTSFSFDENMINSTGSKVRCSKCRHIFVVLPPTPAEEVEPTALSELSPSGKTPVTGAAGLDDLDLDAIEKSLDLETKPAPEKETLTAGEPDDAGLDLDFEDDDTVSGVDAGEASLESTDELDFDLDLDFDSAPGDEKNGTDLSAEATETMDFQLDLDLDDETTEPAAGEDATVADDLNFDLDLGLDETPGGVDALSEGEETTDELDFQLDLDLDDEDIDLSDPEKPVVGTDFDRDEKSVVADSGVEFDETQELDLSDVDSLLDLGHEDVEESVSDEATESLDIDLDFGQEAATIVDSEGEDAEGDSAGEDLEFELDLDPDESAAEPDDTTGALESTEELDLADLDDMIESEEDGEAPAAVDSTADELDLGDELDIGMDQDADIEEGQIAATAAEEKEITDDFDLSGLDDLLELDEEPTSSDDQVGAETVTEGQALEPETVDGGSEGDVGLDGMLDLEMEELVPSDETTEGGGDTDLVLDDDFKSAVETEIGATGEDLDEDDFDLSDLDDMLEIEDSPETHAAEDEDDEFDLDLDLEDVTAEDDTGEADLEFDVEEEEPADNRVAAVAAVAGAATSAAADSDGFDMGSLSNMDDDVGEAEDAVPAAAAKSSEARPAKTKKKRAGGLMKTLLVLVLLIGGGYGAIVGAQYFGIEIPYLDKVKDLNIPYLSDLLDSKQPDAGNLKITIIEKDVDGHFVSSAGLGLLYVVSGKVKNDYDQSRSFIQITGKLYSKGRKLELEKTVFAGNVLSDADLAGLDQAGIDKKLGNRTGRNRSNLNLKKGATLPFMIVFSNLPKDPDEYTVEVAGSIKAKK